MRRTPWLAATLGALCAVACGPTQPSPSGLKPPVAAPPPVIPEASPTKPSAPPLRQLHFTGVARPDNAGWTHDPNDPTVPLLRLTSWATRGSLAEHTIVTYFLTTLPKLYGCYQEHGGGAEAHARLRFRVDASGTPTHYVEQRPTFVDGASDIGSLAECLDEAIWHAAVGTVCRGRRLGATCPPEPRAH